MDCFETKHTAPEINLHPLAWQEAKPDYLHVKITITTQDVKGDTWINGFVYLNQMVLLFIYFENLRSLPDLHIAFGINENRNHC